MGRALAGALERRATTAWSPRHATAMLLWLALWPVWACGDDTAPGTGVMVRIEAQSSTKAALSVLEFRLFRQAGDSWEKVGEHRFEADSIVTWPVEVAVTPDGDPTRVFEVQAIALDADDQSLSETRAVSSYREGQWSTVPLLLEDECRRVPCDSLDDCHGERCRVCRQGDCRLARLLPPVDFDREQDVDAALAQFLEPLTRDADAAAGGDAGAAPDAGFSDGGPAAGGDAGGSDGGACGDGASPGTEMCNGRDDDCDGEMDEGFGDLGSTCQVGSGRCAGDGTLVCRPDGSGAICAGEGDPSQATDELCNGIDDDCDGPTDEGLTGPPCQLTDGVCAGATRRCGGVDGFVACQAGDYDGDYQSDESTCDRLDNDCDGLVDESCCEGTCDLWPQCGCVVGEACYPTSDLMAFECLPPGEGSEGDDCTLASDCGDAMLCLGASGICRRLCTDTADCGGGVGARCALTAVPLDDQACTIACDPFDVTACGGGNKCTTYSDAGGAFTDCVDAGGGTTGVACISDSECAAGFMCVDNGIDEACRQLCGADGPFCSSGICTSFTPPVMLGATEIRVCL